MKPQDALADNNPWDFCGFDGAGILNKNFFGKQKNAGNQRRKHVDKMPPLRELPLTTSSSCVAELPNPKLGGVFFLMIQFNEHICQMGEEKTTNYSTSFCLVNKKTCYFLSLTPHEQLVVFFFPPRGAGSSGSGFPGTCSSDGKAIFLDLWSKGTPPFCRGRMMG